jgi:peptidylprolyl isomerase
LQKLHRGNPKIASGVIQDRKARDKILSVRIAADLPAAGRPHYQVMRTTSSAFAKWMADRINPAPGFYVRQPPKILDVCLSPVPVRRASPD